MFSPLDTIDARRDVEEFLKKVYELTTKEAGEILSEKYGITIEMLEKLSNGK